MKNQQGVILILTMVIMAVLLSTAIAFAVFIISDIRQATAVDNSIAAYYGAEAGLEQGLFWLRQGTDAGQISSVKDLPNFAASEVKLTNNASWSIAGSSDFEPVFSRQRLYNGQSLKLYFLNRRSGANPVKSVKIDWYKGTPGVKMQVIFTQLDPQINSDNAVVYYSDQSATQPSDSLALPSQTFNFKDRNLDNSTGLYDYVMEIRALGGNSDDLIDNLSVTAYDDVNGQGNQLLSGVSGISNLTLKSVGVYNKSRQEIVAHLPPRDPVSGLLGFVLFSEEDITKGY